MSFSSFYFHIFTFFCSFAVLSTIKLFFRPSLFWKLKLLVKLLRWYENYSTENGYRRCPNYSPCGNCFLWSIIQTKYFRLGSKLIWTLIRVWAIFRASTVHINSLNTVCMFSLLKNAMLYSTLLFLSQICSNISQLKKLKFAPFWGTNLDILDIEFIVLHDYTDLVYIIPMILPLLWDTMAGNSFAFTSTKSRNSNLQ